jgi:aryl-alcohol dehydrogenase-like predicted oxidoreductase
MLTISIPDSELTICRLGFGCARMAGSATQRHDWRLLESAHSIGITHFDTAPSYGSEGLLGDVFGSDPSVTIATKVGIPRSNSTRTLRSRIFITAYRSTVRPALSRMPWLKRRLLRSYDRHPVKLESIATRRLSRTSLLEDLEKSLKLLKRSTIDLYLLHEPEGLEIDEDIPEMLIDLKRRGVIGAFGTASGNPARHSQPIGSVEQCRYEAAHRGVVNMETPRIYHGVLRNRMEASVDNERFQRKRSASAIITDVLITNPKCAVIFSASSLHQVRQMKPVLSSVLSTTNSTLHSDLRRVEPRVHR